MAWLRRTRSPMRWCARACWPSPPLPACCPRAERPRWIRWSRCARTEIGRPFVIKLRNIEKSVKLGQGQLYLLRRIDLDIAAGDFVTIMGPSGAGKTTLLAILGLLDAGWNGEYELNGQPVQKLNAKQRGELAKKNIGFVFQQYHLLDQLTVAENLEVPLSYR